MRTSVFGFVNWSFPEDSVVRDVLGRFIQKQVGFNTDQSQKKFKKWSGNMKCIKPPEGSAGDLRGLKCGRICSYV